MTSRRIMKRVREAHLPATARQCFADFVHLGRFAEKLVHLTRNVRIADQTSTQPVSRVTGVDSDLALIPAATFRPSTFGMPRPVIIAENCAEPLLVAKPIKASRALRPAFEDLQV